MSEPSQTSPLQTIAYATPPRVRPPEYLRLKPILRDIAMIFALTCFGGFVIGISGAFKNYSIAAVTWMIAASNLVLGTIGFTLSGYLAPQGNRWPHLLWVALGVWLTGLVNWFFRIDWLLPWLFSSIAIALMMGFGGVISMAFKRNQPE